VLKTIEQRFGLAPLTARDKAAPGLGDVLTLANARTDDPLQGVEIAISNTPHPNQSQPSVIERIHAFKVSQLPLRNDQGTYDHHTPPDLSTSAAIGDYIHTRTAAWTQHLQRRHQRRHANAANTKAAAGRNKKPAARRAGKVTKAKTSASTRKAGKTKKTRKTRK
jgi:phospholipase C